jgi:hypothetical protein
MDESGPRPRAYSRTAVDMMDDDEPPPPPRHVPPQHSSSAPLHGAAAAARPRSGARWSGKVTGLHQTLRLLTAVTAVLVAVRWIYGGPDDAVDLAQHARCGVGAWNSPWTDRSVACARMHRDERVARGNGVRIASALISPPSLQIPLVEAARHAADGDRVSRRALGIPASV